MTEALGRHIKKDATSYKAVHPKYQTTEKMTSITEIKRNLECQT